MIVDVILTPYVQTQCVDADTLPDYVIMCIIFYISKVRPMLSEIAQRKSIIPVISFYIH